MYDELKFIKIDENISYISPTENPLSANVVIIQCENDIWLYDVGSHPDIPAMIDYINPHKKKVNVVLSHFHRDHICNLENIKYDKLYQGKMTYRYTNEGEIVEGDIFIEDVRNEFPQIENIIVCETMEDAIRDSDIISTTTCVGNKEKDFPYIDENWVKKGALICMPSAACFEEKLIATKARVDGVLP